MFICDDDELNLGVNKSLVESLAKKHKFDVNIYTFNEFTSEAITLLRTNQIDIAILDIELKSGDGISIAKIINSYDLEIPIIFVTSYKKYKTYAWDVLAIGFIEKPTNTERFELLFLRAFTLAKEKLEKRSNDYLRIVTDKKAVSIKQDNIIYVEKVLRKVEFKTSNGTYVAGGTLKSYERDMTQDFIKISQSVVVNKKYIQSIDSSNVYLTTGEEIVIGRTYKNDVRGFAKLLDVEKVL